MFIEIDNYFCIDTSEIRVFKQCDNKTACVIYIKDDLKGLTFEDKQGKLYDSLKKIFNVRDALYPDIEQVTPPKVEQSTSDDRKIRW